MQDEGRLKAVQIMSSLGASNARSIMNSLDLKTSTGRREFFRAAVRYAALAGVGVASAVLARRGAQGLGGQSCVNQGICRGCGEFTGCGLPQALSAKRAMNGG